MGVSLAQSGHHISCTATMVTGEMERGAAKFKIKRQKPKWSCCFFTENVINSISDLHFNSFCDSICLFHFSGLHHGSRLSHFTSFLVFLPQQYVWGLCCGCEYHRGTCNSLSGVGKIATGNRPCACLGPAGRDHLTELWKLVFPFLYLAGIVFQRWFSLSLLSGRKISLQINRYCSILAPVLEICSGRWERTVNTPCWHTQVLGSLTWSRSVQCGAEGM